MSATLGVREYPKTRRTGAGAALIAALLVVTGLLVGILIVRAPSTAPAPKVVTVQTSVVPAQTTAVSEAAWLTRAKEAGFKGFGSGTTQSTPRATSSSLDWSSQQALRAAR